MKRYLNLTFDGVFLTLSFDRGGEGGGKALVATKKDLFCSFPNLEGCPRTWCLLDHWSDLDLVLNAEKKLRSDLDSNQKSQNFAPSKYGIDVNQ